MTYSVCFLLIATVVRQLSILIGLAWVTCISLTRVTTDTCASWSTKQAICAPWSTAGLVHGVVQLKSASRPFLVITFTTMTNLVTVIGNCPLEREGRVQLFLFTSGQRLETRKYIHSKLFSITPKLLLHSTCNWLPRCAGKIGLCPWLELYIKQQIVGCSTVDWKIVLACRWNSKEEYLHTCNPQYRITGPQHIITNPQLLSPFI